MTPPNENALGASLYREAERMRTFAHELEHYVRVDLGEHVEHKYPQALVYRQKQVGWETRIKYTYSVDVLASGRAVRHLSMQISVPGEIHQGEMNAVRAHFADQLKGIASLFFPLDTDVGFNARALAAIPVVDPTGERNVHLRTPVAFHFTADHGQVDIGALPQPAREYIASEILGGIYALLHEETDWADKMGGREALTDVRDKIERGDWRKYVPARD